MEAGNLFRQFRQFLPVQAITELTAAENQVDLPVSDIIIEDMMGHRPEGRYARSCTNEKEILFDGFRQREDALGTSQGQLTADGHFIEQISCSRAPLQKYNDQFDDIAAVRPGGDGIATPAFVGLLVDWQVERNELTGFEVEGLQFRQLYPEPARLRRLLFDADYRTCSPRLEHADSLADGNVSLLLIYPNFSGVRKKKGGSLQGTAQKRKNDY